MALNFPDSPTLGQVYTDTTSGFSYEWDGVVWKSYSAASASNIRSIDDISSSFNGTTTIFALTSGGVSVSPVTDNQLIVNLGGVIQDPVDDYNILGSSIQFTTAPAAGLSFSATLLGAGIAVDYANDGNLYYRQTYTATAGQTSFTFTNGYTVGYLDIYRNGVRLSSGTDFTATTGSSFTLTTPAQLNDEIEAIGYRVASIVTTAGVFDNINVVGVITATSFYGSGANLTDIISGVGIQSGSTRVGTGFTDIRFVGAAVTAIGINTAVISVSSAKTLTIGTRSTSQSIQLTSGTTTIGLRGGGTADIPV